ncbi:M28 family peptidase [Arenibacter latericius]|uniref:M28 family peptidase n=1 Tax=Arenibacter latericius TaxID=86104 RepID=UPI00047E0CB7|nr:M28 family peptidase [Arenibacter latericius]MDX1363615.1 M28 family peptidase [Arenibacter latericius]
MKRFPTVISLLLILLAIYLGFWTSMPTYTPDIDIEETQFSTDRAFTHVKTMSVEPHAVGFSAHSTVREYLIGELEKLGLEPILQSGYTAGDWANFSKVTNVMARIKGRMSGNALLLLSHYDSSPHSSLGASDAASGVATILEGVRAFLSANNNPENDIIILFSDAEELGLNGADLFVNNHPWAKEVKLALNFEARGSGGPSYMLLETNRGNSSLINGFIDANPSYPVANSLVYSIYKMLPNDTDLTVFREDGDIDGFNFAFIDDHFDYHTVRDNYDRLDPKTLAHQGAYLMPLLSYFSNADLTQLKSLNDQVYFNIPFFNLLSYPFEWIYPMLIGAVVIFLFLVFLGIKKDTLNFKGIGKGFIPMLMTLIINGIIGYFGWTVLLKIYPQYQDLLHGFTYNGYTYIAAFVFLSIAVAFWCYHRFGKTDAPNLVIAPAFLWLIICGLLAVYLKGGSFFILPVFALLASLWILINQKSPQPLWFVVLALPAIWIYSPLIKMFPVGLGLKMIITSTLLSSLTFFLLLPIFGGIKVKQRLAALSLLLFVGFIISAHFNSGFTKDQAKPTSLIYLLDAESNTAQWATYDQVLSNWTSQYIGENKEIPTTTTGHKNLSSKYGTGFSFIAKAPLKDLAQPKVAIEKDTIIGDSRWLEVSITPQRPINRLEVFTNDIQLSKAIINNIPLSDSYLENRKGNKLITHYVSDNDPTHLKLVIPKQSKLELTIYEASNDLLNHPQFSVPQRPEDNIPMPFVLNDAILITKKLHFE